MSPQNHLTALPLELHTLVFSNLQPYDILQVRQTCQTLYHASSGRTVWVDALHRICVENTLFEPSFPVANMSVLELQHASMGPHCWIARSSSKERNSDGVLPHSVTRHLMSAMSDLSMADLYILRWHYLIPGGRYLFSMSYHWLVLWDLGSPYSSSREPHSVAAVPVKFRGRGYLVHSTPDGMGLRVFLHNVSDDMTITSLYIYEIYPESASPQLTQIAYTHISRSYSFNLFSLSYDRLAFTNGNILTVWDYKANLRASWGIEDDSKQVPLIERGYKQILATKSAVMLIRPYGVSVWEIPPLLPESSLSISTDPSVLSPAFVLHYPENHLYHHFPLTPCGWYSGTPQPLYYDVQGGRDDVPPKMYRFEVAINSTISGGTLKLLKTFEVSAIKDYFFSLNARICQDKNVTTFIDSQTGCLETYTTDIYDQQLPSFGTPLCRVRHMDISGVAFCPTTGRVVYRTIDNWMTTSIIALDF